MEGTLIAILVVAIPVILFPVAFIWAINIGGIAHLVRQARATRAKKAAAAKVNA